MTAVPVGWAVRGKSPASLGDYTILASGGSVFDATDLATIITDPPAAWACARENAPIPWAFQSSMETPITRTINGFHKHRKGAGISWLIFGRDGQCPRRRLRRPMTLSVGCAPTAGARR